MKKFLLFLLFLAAFTVGTTSCVFEDIADDEPTAVFACAVAALCLLCYVAKCAVQALAPDEEEQLIEALSLRSEIP